MPPASGVRPRRARRFSRATVARRGGDTTSPLPNAATPGSQLRRGGCRVRRDRRTQELPGQARGGLVAFHSGDGGTTWDDRPNGLGSPHDHPTVVVDGNVVAHANWVYVVSTKNLRVDGESRSSIVVARRSNGGRQVAIISEWFRTTIEHSTSSGPMLATRCFNCGARLWVSTQNSATSVEVLIPCSAR